MRGLLDRWREYRQAKHRSGWDNPVTGTDLLRTMLDADKARTTRRLP